jgi:hypothetical protein
MKIGDNISRYRLAAISFIGIAMLVISPSCFNDDFNKAMKLELFPYQVMVPVNNVPVPGNGGIITNGVVTGTSIQLMWTRATDVETLQPDLEYILYRSDTNNINTPDEAAKNGTVVTGWQNDIASAVADTLLPGTTYYFNVVVRDGEGNRAAYVTVAVTTQTDAVYIFSAGTYMGNLTTPKSPSPRDDIDALCNLGKMKSSTPPCLYTRAFISVSAGDDIASMPKNYGVPTDKIIISTTNIKIADNWFDLLDGTIDETLNKAGVANNFWWSGSDVNGGYPDFKSMASTSTNCANWTDGTNSSWGNEGATNKTDSSWIYDGYIVCNNSLHVLCICW